MVPLIKVIINIISMTYKHNRCKFISIYVNSKGFRKLHAKCLLVNNKNAEATYNLVEALAPSVRTMATYRAERNYIKG